MPPSGDPIYPIFLAGGMGTRLWPVSRQLYPKQLVRFIGKDSLIQATIKRMLPVADPKNIRIVCGREHYHEMARHLRDLDISPGRGIISEPCGRNTAPAILLSVLKIMQAEKNAILCIFPADHVIENNQAFLEMVDTAVSLARQNHIVTFGIKPHYPETGYGYIEGADALSGGALSIRRFVEKPDPETAETYLAAGRFFWNSGMFTFRASVMVEEFQKFQPELLDQMTEIVSQGEHVSLESYQRLENISIDYAIMEKTERGVVLPSDFGWSDIGSWKSLHDFIAKDKDQNVSIGDVIARNARGSFIMGQSRLVAVNNIVDLAVVETPDAVFISDLASSREVKSIVGELKAADRQEYYRHGTVYHQWGSLTRLEKKRDYTVDRLEIFPGFAMNSTAVSEDTLNLVVVEGRMTVIDAQRSVSLKAGESTTVSCTDTLKIENSSNLPASVIRVKTPTERNGLRDPETI